ncbi:hypothetical protein A3194_12410 [Candidatus Thiodiazotropha endoloripes]|uniref:FliM/FliN family flagellar motor switch protein n=1 Tax=Candidatus Thiodiazotropha endoloripes TaxID=1818881 RepID=UPI00083CBFE1|nr:FliM/FliN family flagellar motor switch protein [Candidatus Thiodiazotropha endoloripes]ODB85630.1 hypothetical protein A3194_12410 [Candidatus Thiodiazotropha endoloripes]
MTNNTNDKSTRTVEQVQLNELPNTTPQGSAIFNSNLDIIKDVRVKLEACIGEADVTVEELYSLKVDSVVKLDRDALEPIDLYLDGRVVARGQLVVTGDHFGVCITELYKENAS